MYKIIDAHCHVYPQKIAVKASAATANFYGFTEDQILDGTSQTLLAEGDQAGISHYVIHSVATKPEQVHSINSYIADIVSTAPEKFTGYGTVHPDTQSAEQDIAHIMQLGLKGVKIHPDIQKIAIDDPKLMRFYEICEGELIMLFHTGDKRYDYSNPNRLMHVLEAFPQMKVIGAHFGGYTLWEEAAMQLCKKYDNFYVDCSSSLFALSPERGRALIHMYGADRVLFGSDYPLWSPQTEVKRFFELGLTEEENQKILYQNASDLIGITL